MLSLSAKLTTRTKGIYDVAVNPLYSRLGVILAIAGKGIYELYKVDHESTSQYKKQTHEIQTQATNTPNQSYLPPKKPNNTLKRTINSLLFFIFIHLSLIWYLRQLIAS